MPVRRCLLLSLLMLPAAGCSAPTPSHFTRLWIEGTTGTPIIGTSTEDGVLLITEPEWDVGQMFEIQFPVGNSIVRDWGRIDRLNDNLAVVVPITARLREGRIATALPQPGEQVYLALRDERDQPVMEPVKLWGEGGYGDWIVLPGRTPDQSGTIAHDYRGTGVYVERAGRWQIVGVLAGLLAQDEIDPRGEVALGFIGLVEMSRILPDRTLYFAHDVRPLRPDFEFGVPLQPGDVALNPPAGESQEVGPGDAPAPGNPPATPGAGSGGSPPRR